MPSNSAASARDADDGPAVRALTERISQSELHRRFLRALGEQVRAHSAFDAKPLEADLAAPLPSKIRLYIFNCTRPPGGRPLGEHKVQLIVPGQRRGERSSLDEWAAGSCSSPAMPPMRILTLWDAGLYTDFAWSRNVQVKAETIIEATAGRIAVQERRLRPSDGARSQRPALPALPSASPTPFSSAWRSRASA